MRTLTLKRHATLLGINVKAGVYLDHSCIGELRNGEEKAFQISEDEHLLTVSGRGAYDGSVTIPAGRADLRLTFDCHSYDAFHNEWYFPGEVGVRTWWQPSWEVDILKKYAEAEKRGE